MSHRLHIWTVGHLVVCVPADLPDEVLAEVRAQLHETATVDGVIEVLTAGGLAATPPFVCAATDDLGVRVVIRGDLQVMAHGRDGSALMLSAGRSSTWNDDVVTDIASLSVSLGDDGGRFEWLAAPAPAGAVAPSPPARADGAVPPAPAPAAPRPVPDAVRSPEPPEPVEPAAVEPQDTAAAAPLTSPGDDTAVGVAVPAADAPAPGVVPSAPDGKPDQDVRERDSQQSNTLDEAAFLSVVADGPDEDQPSAADASAEDPAPPGPPTAPAGPLDFSSLLEHTHHGPAATPPATPAATRPPSPPPPPAPAAAPAAAPPPPPPSAPVPAATAPTALVPVVGIAPPPGSPAPLAPLPVVASGTVPPPPTPPAETTGLGEHDGRTITLADLRRQQGGEALITPPPGASVPAATTLRPGEVKAVRCPHGHANPPTAASCRLCGQPVTDRAVVAVPRPVVARLVFDSGLVVDVDRPQLIGRRPTAPPDAEEIPNLLTVPSPEAEISRAHTAVRLAGWDVLVEDVGSTNGTEVALPGRDPVRLREHEPVLVVVGTEVTLAGTVHFRIDAPEA